MRRRRLARIGSASPIRSWSSSRPERCRQVPLGYSCASVRLAGSNADHPARLRRGGIGLPLASRSREPVELAQGRRRRAGAAAPTGHDPGPRIRRHRRRARPESRRRRHVRADGATGRTLSCAAAPRLDRASRRVALRPASASTATRSAAASWPAASWPSAAAASATTATTATTAATAATSSAAAASSASTATCSATARRPETAAARLGEGRQEPQAHRASRQEVGRGAPAQKCWKSGRSEDTLAEVPPDAVGRLARRWT
jgi:hypothetical protein